VPGDLLGTFAGEALDLQARFRSFDAVRLELPSPSVSGFGERLAH
jgi:hypothetical protein